MSRIYHLIAPDFPGFGQSDAPPPSSYMYTFDNLAKTINDLLEQLKINKYTFYHGGPVGFRIILAHPERLQTLIIQNANAYKEGPGAKWAAIAHYWADPKAHPEVFDAFVSPRRPNSVTPSAPRIPNAITRTPGLTNTPTCRDPANARSRPIRCTTTGRMSRLIRRGKRSCASTSRRRW